MSVTAVVMPLHNTCLSVHEGSADIIEREMQDQTTQSCRSCSETCFESQSQNPTSFIRHVQPSSSHYMLPLLLPLLASLLLPTNALTLPELRHRSIYQVFTDRFARSDGQLTYCDPAQRDYCGGTWKGIEHHLDYIQHMGFDTSQLKSGFL